MCTMSRQGSSVSRVKRLKGSAVVLGSLVFLWMPGTSWASCPGCSGWSDGRVRVEIASFDPNTRTVGLEVGHDCDQGGEIYYSTASRSLTTINLAKQRFGWRGGRIDFEAQSSDQSSSDDNEIVVISLHSLCLGLQDHSADVELCLPNCEGETSHEEVATVSGEAPDLERFVIFFLNASYFKDRNSSGVNTDLGARFDLFWKGRFGVQVAALAAEDEIPFSDLASEATQDVLLGDLRGAFNFFRTCRIEAGAFLGVGYSDLEVDTKRYAKGWGATAGVGFKARMNDHFFAGADLLARYQHGKDESQINLESAVFVGIAF
ncbi:MAG: outer membrane beta-barrel protein [Acidobacteriota bacterium]